MKVSRVEPCTVDGVRGFLVIFEPDPSTGLIVRQRAKSNGDAPLDILETTAFALAEHIYEQQKAK